MKIYSAPEMKLMLDYGDMGMSEAFLKGNEALALKALKDMESLEAGAIANPSENRMVGHYWLRAPQFAPSQEIRREIEACTASVKAFTAKVHSGEIRPKGAERFTGAVICGIGGSSLGPEFVSGALKEPGDKMRLWFMDNTDPDGMDRIFAQVKERLGETLFIVISKSGGTIETRNCMLEAKAFCESNGASFCERAVCVSGAGSRLHRQAEAEGWLAFFPMWDWVGGRTSLLSAVGLLPLGLQGIDTDALLRGAAECDEWSRCRDIENNPALLMALAWLSASGGKGGVTNVILPYKDRLVLLPKYLQQLVMESLGKEFDLDGKTVNQGLAVMGNKGSSDQHSYVQQLVAGPSNIFVTFVQVLKDREGASPDVGGGSTSGDYLSAFMLGTRRALTGHGKAVMSISVPLADAQCIGRIIALFERSVGFYASMINVNAYDQPAVEYGKKAADSLIALKDRLLGALGPSPRSAKSLADELSADFADCFRLLLHLAYTKVNVGMKAAPRAEDSLFFLKDKK